MTLRLLALLLAPLSLIPMAPTLAVAQQRALTQREMFLVQSVVFQSSSKIAALTRRFDAALTARSNEIARLIVQLREQQAAERRANRALAATRADNERLEAQIIRMTKAFNEELAAKDAEFARDREAMERDALDLMATSEGKRGMEAFASNEPGSVELANNIWDRLIDMRTARQLRQIATINETKLGQGQVTTVSLIARFEKIPASDRLHEDWVTLSRLYDSTNNRAQARAAAQSALDLATNDFERSVALVELGNVLSSENQSEARRFYNQSLAIREKLSAGDDSSVSLQRHLAHSYSDAGGYLMDEDRSQAKIYFEKSLIIFESMITKEPNNKSLRYDLTHIYRKMGDLFFEENSVLSRDYYQKSLDIAKNLLSDDPSDTKAQAALGIVHGSLGTLLFDDKESSFYHYSQSQLIIEDLRLKDPENVNLQMYLIMIHFGLTEFFDDDRHSARYNLEHGIRLIENMISKDPDNTEFQTTLIIGYWRLGNLLAFEDRMAQRSNFQKSLAIAEKLTAKDPANVEFQLTHSTSLNLLADTYVINDRSKTLKHYLENLNLLENLSHRYPKSIEVNVRLWEQYEMVAAHQIIDDPQESVRRLEQGYRALERIARAHPSNAELQRTLLLGLALRADMKEPDHSWTRTKVLLDNMRLKGQLAQEDEELASLIDARAKEEK